MRFHDRFDLQKFKKSKFNVRRFRRRQMAISIVYFIVSFIVFWRYTGFEITEIQLSYWGIGKYGWIWNSCLVLISMSTFFNVYRYIKTHNRLHKKKYLFQYAFGFTAVCLFLTGMISMEYPLHNVTAFSYFFSYPIIIFAMAFVNRKSLPYNEWLNHFSISIAMIIFPLLSISFFKGMAIPETIHAAIVIYWNIYLTQVEPLSDDSKRNVQIETDEESIDNRRSRVHWIEPDQRNLGKNEMGSSQSRLSNIRWKSDKHPLKPIKPGKIPLPHDEPERPVGDGEVVSDDEV